MSTKANQMFVSPGSEGESISLATTTPKDIVSVKNKGSGVETKTEKRTRTEKQSAIASQQQTKQSESKVLGELISSGGKLTDTTKQKAMDLETTRRIKSSVGEAVGDVNISQSIPEDVLNVIGEKVGGGEVDLSKTRTINELGGIVNALKGSNCMSPEVNQLLNQELLGALADSGFKLNIESLFQCLVEQFRGEGVRFINTANKNATEVVRDGSMANLQNVTGVLGKQTKEAIPNYKTATAYFESQGDPKTDATLINGTMKEVDSDWVYEREHIDADVFANASGDAKKAFEQSDDVTTRIGSAISDMFG